VSRILLTLRYDGTGYCGWQVQPNGITVQQRMQDAIEAVTGIRSGLTGCSRTDAGVHANMFCCTFDTESPIRGNKLASALNAHLPRDIAVAECREVSQEFHPRYDAAGKRYVYRIWNAPQRNPFLDKYALHIRHSLDTTMMNTAAADAVGRHDFAAFCAAGSSVDDTVRTMQDCHIERDGDIVNIIAQADGFLYNMVRILAGTLVEIGSHRRLADSIAIALKSKNREDAGYTAPAHALVLDKVYYE